MAQIHTGMTIMLHLCGCDRLECDHRPGTVKTLDLCHFILSSYSIKPTLYFTDKIQCAERPVHLQYPCLVHHELGPRTVLGVREGTF